MQIYSLDLSTLPQLPHLVLAIGNFDGVHLGHQALLSKTLTLAKAHQLASAVMVFEPQPKEHFDPQNAPARLSTLSEKCVEFERFGMEYVLAVAFDNAFANKSADEFCALLHALNVKALVLGDDFVFGRGRMGNIATLQQHFLVTQVAPILIDNQRVSSTLVRQALSMGQLALAEKFLGRSYQMMGEVVAGDKIGRQLGFPTANLALNRLRPAPLGVFAVAVFCADGFDETMGGLKWGSGLFGCANAGVRPSVDGQSWRLEVHLPNFKGDLYGKVLSVQFLWYLHGEKKYDGIVALRQGVANDVDELLLWYRSQITTKKL